MDLKLDREHVSKRNLKKLERLMEINNWANHHIDKFDKAHLFKEHAKRTFTGDPKPIAAWLEDIWSNRNSLHKNSVTLCLPDKGQLKVASTHIHECYRVDCIWIIGIGCLKLKTWDSKLKWWAHRRIEVHYDIYTDSFTFFLKQPVETSVEIEEIQQKQNDVFNGALIIMSGNFTKQELHDLVNELQEKKNACED